MFVSIDGFEAFGFPLKNVIEVFAEYKFLFYWKVQPVLLNFIRGPINIFPCISYLVKTALSVLNHVIWVGKVNMDSINDILESRLHSLEDNVENKKWIVQPPIYK